MPPVRRDYEVVGQTFAAASDSNPNLTYTVTVRPDTQNGGTYLHCTCPSWPRSVSKGGCKHVLRIQGGRAAPWQVTPIATLAPIAISERPASAVLPPGVSEADVAAARLILNRHVVPVIPGDPVRMRFIDITDIVRGWEA